MNANVADLEGCYDLSNPIVVTRNAPEAGAIAITDSGETEATICVDGVADPIAVTRSGATSGSESGWVITDTNTGEILGLPAAGPFNLDPAGPGVCSIWYIAYEPGLTGLSVNANVADLEGCYDLSNPIVVTRVEGEDCEILSTTLIETDFNFVVYPNPTTNRINIQYNGNQNLDLQIEVIDMLGKQVLQSKAGASRTLGVDLNALHAGTYFLNVRDLNSGNAFVKRVIKN